jgi:hypothetical protein
MGRFDIRLSPISMNTDIRQSAHLCTVHWWGRERFDVDVGRWAYINWWEGDDVDADWGEGDVDADGERDEVDVGRSWSLNVLVKVGGWI